MTIAAMPRHRASRLRRAFRRVGRAVSELRLPGYARGWDEAVGLAVESLEGLMRDADGTVVSKADVKALAVRLRREADH